jgi:ferredoxin-fold anticodon binding domain-containing protein
MVYPNPVSDVIYVQSGNAVIADIEIVDLLGRTIAFNHINGRACQISVKEMVSGTYIVLIHSNCATIQRMLNVTRD